MTTITLPYPPSANRMWRNVPGKGTLKSAPYRAWISRALGEIMVQRAKPVHGRYRLTIIAVRPDNRARDVDNLAKPIGDILATAGIVKNDSLAQSVFLGWSLESPVKDGSIIVSIEPFTEPLQLLGKAA